MKKIRLSRNTTLNSIGSTLIIACLAAVGFFFRERLFGEDYHIIDYDFYVKKGILYAFVIEGKGEENYNKISGKTYVCGKRVLVFKKDLDPPVPC